MKKTLLLFAAVSVLFASLSFGQASAYSGIDDEGTIQITGEVTPLDITVTYEDQEELYNSASLKNRMGASLAPQTVHATALDNAFFKIDTWLGDKWIYLKFSQCY